MFPPGRPATAFGISSLGPPFGAALGIAFGASIAAAFDWRYAFITIGLVGLLTSAAVRLFVREPVRGRFDTNAGLGAIPSERSESPVIPSERSESRDLHLSSAKSSFTDTLRMFFSRKSLVLAALGSGATQMITYGMGNFTTLFLMREKGMTLKEVAVWYALVAAIGMGSG